MEIKQKPQLHREWIDPDAVQIVATLQKNKFTTYLVGGCVRDLLLGIHPKDYDIVTHASPQDVRRLIPRAYIIGRRFRLVLVRRGEDQFEVATFRRAAKADESPEDIPFGDNIFGTPEEDALRRDFTINGLFYDPIGNELIDFCQGVPDINNRILRMIGDPEVRLLEDPIRILRGLRLAHKLDLTLDPKLRECFEKYADSLKLSVLPRRREEILKILKLDEPWRILLEAFDLGILAAVAPTLHRVIEENGEAFEYMMAALQRSRSPRPGPVSLFLPLVMMWIHSFTDNSKEFRPTDLLEDKNFLSFVKEELGMFQVEFRQIIYGLDHVKQLPEISDFERRGQRRRINYLQREGFEDLLEVARWDYLLSCEQLHYWEKSFAQAKAGANPKSQSESPGSEEEA